MLLAVLIGALNFFLSLIRPLLYRLRHRSMDRYRFVSGLPGIGTLLVLVGVVIGFGGCFTALSGMFAMVIDTGGSLWFVWATWRDSSLWDA
jgi:hypothetical protein